jgi:hypothetical protein
MKLRKKAMKDEKTQGDLNKSELSVEMPDEALEAAACLGPRNGGYFSIAMCAGQAECPF